MTYTDITPSLEHIERALFGPSDLLLERWAQSPDKIPSDTLASLEADEVAIKLRNDLMNQKAQEVIESSDAVSLPITMPSFLKQTVQRHLHVQNTDFSHVPQAGQIVSVTKINGPKGALGWDLPRPHAVLLSDPTEHPDIWYGWLVAPETLYAGEWDFVIQDDDGTVSPFAGMVQMLNPVHVYLCNVGTVIGQLTENALQTVRMLGMSMVTNTPLPVMGQAGAWVMREIDGRVIVTGSDILDEEDPRVQYQILYAHAVQAVTEPARLVAAEPSYWNKLLTVIQKKFQDMDKYLVPQPRIAMAMGEHNEPTDMAYQLGTFPLMMHLSSEEQSMVNIVIHHQDSEESFIISVLDDSGMPYVEKMLNSRNPKAKISIPIHDTFSLNILGESNCKEVRIDSISLDMLGQ